MEMVYVYHKRTSARVLGFAVAFVLGMMLVTVAAAKDVVEDHLAAKTAEYVCRLDEPGYPGQVDRIEIGLSLSVDADDSRQPGK